MLSYPYSLLKFPSLTVFILLCFSRRDCHYTIFGHMSKVVTLVSFHFSAQGFKTIVVSSLCFTRPSWITILCMNFKVVYVSDIFSAIYNLCPKLLHA
jgi:hypothetical protein